jgi:hypothetical protein
MLTSPFSPLGDDLEKSSYSCQGNIPVVWDYQFVQYSIHKSISDPDQAWLGWLLRLGASCWPKKWPAAAVGTNNSMQYRKYPDYEYYYIGT